MLILLGEQYVNPEHIVEVVSHPAGTEVCVILANGREIRFKRENESKAEAVDRVARHIMSKVGSKR